MCHDCKANILHNRWTNRTESKLLSYGDLSLVYNDADLTYSADFFYWKVIISTALGAVFGLYYDERPSQFGIIMLVYERQAGSHRIGK